MAYSLLNILTEEKIVRKFAEEKVVSLLKKYFACASNDFRGWGVSRSERTLKKGPFSFIRENLQSKQFSITLVYVFGYDIERKILFVWIQNITRDGISY